ncbi:hypothetical protein SDC9_175250 [bioreactor metagenome]|uniref:Uncharacterized protein n=1 Tax=bioreactor metagenome TaxID=1076179 RepID=A0A645GNR2_9ZZZZ
MGYNTATESTSKTTTTDIANRDYFIGQADVTYDLRHGIKQNIVTLAGNVKSVHPDEVDYSLYLK